MNDPLPDRELQYHCSSVAVFRPSTSPKVCAIVVGPPGSVRPLPPAADLTAYRVVQEALTNVGKHAPGAAARVRLSFQPEALHIVVEDNGNSRPDQPADASPDSAGHGIVGMRERVSAIGGSLDTGSRPGGGFRVSAVLPLPQGDRP